MGGPLANEPECYTTLAFLAANTERAMLTAMVTGVHFRHPAVLAKTVTTLDVLSRGRAWLGIGSGHYEEETRGLGIPFPPQRERFEMLEETVQICLMMWSGERGDERPFDVKHYKLERPLNLPQSLSRPHPPIMIAGDGENGQKVGQLLGQLRWLGEMGVETVIGVVPNVDRITPLEIIGREVIPAVADL